MDNPEGYSPTLPPVPMSAFPQIATVCLIAGFVSSALFIAHQAIGTKQNRSIKRDLAIAMFASVNLGVGFIFGLLATGIWF